VHELSGANFEGAINAVAIDDPIPPCDEADDPDCNTLSARTFGEASINLTDAGIFPTGTCTEFGSAYLKSRSSDSFTAALKDFIAPIPVDIANCGSIEIIKDSVPNSTQDFAYTTTGTGLSAFTLDDDGDETDEPATPGDGGDWPNSITFSDVFAGTYTVTETLPVAGWSLTDISCTDPDGGNSSGNVGTATATINVAVSETVTCTFTNKKDATVTITKDAIPDSGQDFGYTTSGAGLSAFTLEDDGDETNEPATPGDGGDWPNTKSFTISGADFGAKTVTETVPSGWSLTGLTCSEGTTNTATGIASFTVDPGDAISCAYTNKKDATVTITKDADPNALTDFSFDVTGTGPAGWVDFDLDDDADVTGGNDTLLNSQTFTFSGNQFGSKTVTETPIPSGWDLGQISCSGDDNYEIGTDSDADFTDGDTKVTLDVDPGETISCTFTNDSLHLVIVLVCHQGTGTLVASDVTLDSDTVTSLSSAPSGLTDAQLCALLDARFEDLEHGEIDLTVDVGSGHLP
jgi:hypothetical protein